MGTTMLLPSRLINTSPQRSPFGLYPRTLFRPQIVSVLRGYWGEGMRPDIDTIARFVRRVESNEHDAAIAEFYADNAVMRENQSDPREGRENHIARERSVLA